MYSKCVPNTHCPTRVCVAVSFILQDRRDTISHDWCPMQPVDLPSLSLSLFPVRNGSRSRIVIWHRTTADYVRIKVCWENGLSVCLPECQRNTSSLYKGFPSTLWEYFQLLFPGSKQCSLPTTSTSPSLFVQPPFWFFTLFFIIQLFNFAGSNLLHTLNFY